MNVLKFSDPVAKIEHICEGCGRTIQRGEKYHRQEGVSDYGFETWKCCAQCVALCRDLWKENVRGENEYGIDCWVYLPDVDWTDYPLMIDGWPECRDGFLARWTTPDGSLIDYTRAAPPTPDGGPE